MKLRTKGGTLLKFSVEIFFTYLNSNHFIYAYLCPKTRLWLLFYPIETFLGFKMIVPILRSNRFSQWMVLNRFKFRLNTQIFLQNPMQGFWRINFTQYFSMGLNEMLFSHSRDWLVGTILDEPAIFRNFYRKNFQDNHRIFLQIRIENILLHHPASRNFLIRLHFRVPGIMSNENFL